MQHLIHIGYAKAGSSILQRWFAEHPQIAFERDGLAGFRTVYDVSRMVSAPQGGLRLRVTSEESLATPHGAAGGSFAQLAKALTSMPHAGAERVCDALAQVFPNASVLLVTRGFRQIMLSSYSQAVRVGETAPFFALNPDYGSVGHRSRPVWDYDRIIDLYARAFAGRVLVLPFELLRDDPDRFVRVVEERFGLDHHPLPRVTENPSLSGVELLWYPRITHALHRSPLPGRLKRSLVALHLELVARGAMRPLVRLLQRLRPGTRVGAHMISDGVLENFRGRTDRLRDDPLYAPYSTDYLF